VSNIGPDRVHFSSMRPERTGFSIVNPNPTIVSGSIWEGNETASCRAYPGRWAFTGRLALTRPLSHRVRAESIGRRYRSILSPQMITLAPTHIDRAHMGLKFAIAVGEKTPSLVNLLKRNLACADREDDDQRYFGIDQYVRPIDSAALFCPNRY
jgi:hypothetical protein